MLSPLFPGESDIDQLFRVIGLLGSPHAVVWPGVEALPDFHKISSEWPKRKHRATPFGQCRSPRVPIQAH